MIKLLCFVFFAVITHVCAGQEYSALQETKIDSIILSSKLTTSSKLTFVSVNGGTAILIATLDIEKDSVFIILKSGYAPVRYTTDGAFEKKYDIRFMELGCVGPSLENLRSYNYTVFDFLETKFGKSWRKEIRKDAVGFKEWKRRN